MADDMRWDAMGCAGNPLAITPNIDNLAASGTRFTQAHVTTSICMISRASVLSGQYARRHGIDDFSKSFPATAWDQTYPMILRREGYYTGFIGKFGVGNHMPAADFDYWKGFPGHGVYFYPDGEGGSIHSTALMGQQMQEFLINRDPKKPFCLSVSFKAPHSEDGVAENNGFRPDPIFESWYTTTRFPVPPTYHDSFYMRFPPDWRRDDKMRENEARVRFGMRFAGDDKYQTTTRAIYRLVSGIDKVLGELRAFLRQQGLEQNTIVIFTSDNGYYLGENGLEGKWYGHDPSIRIPLIIFDPRIRKQRPVAEEMVLNIDFAPTILAMAQVQVPAAMQGKNLSPLLRKADDGWRDGFFYEHTYDPGTYPVYIPHTIGWVTRSLKYMRYYKGRDSNSILHEELFDRQADPHEMHNRANDPRFLAKKQELIRLTKQHEDLLR